MTFIPLDSNNNVYTFTSYICNFWFSSSHVKLGTILGSQRSPRETNPSSIQRSELHAELKVQPQLGHHYFMSRLVVGIPEGALMDIISGIKIRPQLQDIIRWATSFRVYFGLHLWGFICFLSKQPDVMRIITIHFHHLWNGDMYVHSLKKHNALMTVCQYRIGTSWWETSCNWLRTRQEPACYLWLMCALFMITNDEVECNPLSLSLIGCILESTSAMYGSPQTVLCWFCESQVLGI